MAVRFDAYGDYFYRTDWPTYNAATTYMGWFYLTTVSGWQCIFHVGGDGTGSLNNYWYLGVFGDELYVEWGVNNISSTDPLSTGWHHLCWSKSSGTSANYRGYVDGVEVVSVDARSVDDPGTGGNPRSSISHDNGRWSEWLDGRAHSVKIWDGVQLSQQQIQQEMQAIRPINSDGNIWGWYPIFPGASERVLDYSGNGRDWTAAGTLTDEDPPPIPWGAPVLMPQKETKARGFSFDPDDSAWSDGSGYRYTGTTPFNSLYTVSLWFYLYTIASADRILTGLQGFGTGNEEAFMTWGLAPTNLRSVIRIGPSSQAQLGSTSLVADTWYHFGIIRSSLANAQMYLNGVAEGSPNTRDITGRAAHTGINYGMVYNAVNPAKVSSNLPGYMAAIKIWDTNLSVTELQHEMFTYRPQKTDNLWAVYYEFAGNMAYDLSGNNRHLMTRIRGQ